MTVFNLLQIERGQEKNQCLQQGKGCCNFCLPLGHMKTMNLSCLGLVRHGAQSSSDSAVTPRSEKLFRT